MIRKLPIYFLIDNSESMLSGNSVETIKNGLNSFIDKLKGEPHALETAYLSLITYSEFAIQHNQLTDLLQFQVPSMVPLGRSKSFGAALQLLSYSLENEIAQPNANEKGDWRPLVMILTDGVPTDDWQDELAELQKKRAKIIVCIADHNFDFSIYKKMTSRIFRLNAMSDDALKGFFNWETIFPFEEGSLITNSISIKSTKVELPPPPPSIDIDPEIKNTPSKEHIRYNSRLRKQPIYILADVSSKEYLELINIGFCTILEALRGEPQMLETAYISLINFGYVSKLETPLTDLISFTIFDISKQAGWGTALKLACKKIDLEVNKWTIEQKGDFNPYAFVLINGDSIQRLKDFEIKDLKRRKIKLIFFVRELSKSNRVILENLYSEIDQHPEIYNLENTTKNDISAFFNWYS